MRATETLRFEVTGRNADEIRTEVRKHLATYSNTVDGWTYTVEVFPLLTTMRGGVEVWTADVEAWR